MLRIVLSTLLLVAYADAFSNTALLSPSARQQHRFLSTVTCSQPGDVSRRAALPLLGGAALLALRPQNAEALVKGVAPPEGYGRRKNNEGGGDKSITNMQEARELGAKREAAMFDKEDGKFKTTKAGDRYRDVTEGTGAEVTEGSVAAIKYRVLRLGKRSRDGLSGEASLVFSFGYGEDDDKESDVLEVEAGGAGLVPAVGAALLGMRAGGTRRVAVRPERGWRSADPGCGAAIDMGAAVGLPGAEVTQAESCMDVSRIPAPKTFQAKRKLARRFDESMLLELQVVAVRPK